MIRVQSFIFKISAALLFSFVAVSPAHAESDSWISRLSSGVSYYNNMMVNAVTRPVVNAYISNFEVGTIFQDPRLAGYFQSQQEIDQAVARIKTKYSVAGGDADSISGIVMAKHRATVDATIREIVGKVFDKENIRLQTSKEEWQNELVREFNSCADKAQSDSGIVKCQEELTKRLPSELGKAVVMATAKEDLASKFSQKVDVDGVPKELKAEYSVRAGMKYKQCLAATGNSKEPTTLQINTCARQSLFTTIKEYAAEETRSARVEKKLSAHGKADVELQAELARCLDRIDKNACLPEQEGQSSCISAKSVRAEAKVCGAKYSKAQAGHIASEVAMAQLKDAPKGYDKAAQAAKAEKAISDCYNGSSQEAIDACVVQQSTQIQKEIATDVGRATVNEIYDKQKAEIKGAANEENRAKLEESRERTFKDFSECIQNSGNEEEFKSCTQGEKLREIKNNAAIELGEVLGKGKLQELLHTSENSPEFNKILSVYKACVAANKHISQAQCEDRYRVSMTKFIAGVRVKYSMGQLMGQEGLNAKKSEVDAMLKKFNACTDSTLVYTDLASRSTAFNNLKSYRQSRCTETLNKSGLDLTKKVAAEKLIDKGDSAATKAAKQKVANNTIDTVVTASNAESKAEAAGAASNSESSKKDIYAGSQDIPQQGFVQSAEAQTIKEYVNQDPQAAAVQTEALKQAAENADAQGKHGEALRADIMKAAENTGATDQAVRGIIRSAIMQNLKDMSSAGVDTAQISKLLSPANLKKIFNSATIEELHIKDKILEPLFVKGASIDDPKVKAAYDELKKRIVKQLAMSDEFGLMLAQDGLQKGIDKKISKMEGLEKFFASMANPKWKQICNKKAIQGELKADCEKTEQCVQREYIIPVMEDTISNAQKSSVIAKCSRMAAKVVEGSIMGRYGSSSSSSRTPTTSNDFIQCSMTNSCPTYAPPKPKKRKSVDYSTGDF